MKYTLNDFPILVQAAVTEYHRLGSLTAIISSSQFWRLEVQDQGASRLGVW